MRSHRVPRLGVMFSSVSMGTSSEIWSGVKMLGASTPGSLGVLEKERAALRLELRLALEEGLAAAVVLSFNRGLGLEKFMGMPSDLRAERSSTFIRNGLTLLPGVWLDLLRLLTSRTGEPFPAGLAPSNKYQHLLISELFEQCIKLCC